MLTQTLKIALLGLTLSGAVAGAVAFAGPRAEATAARRTTAPRPVRRPPPVEGCFVPPPEPVAVVAPCSDDRSSR